MAFAHSRRRWFGTYSCKPVPRDLPSSIKQLHTSRPFRPSLRSWRTIAGIASTANGLWMSQIGRRVTDAVDGILNGKRYLIHDRDPLFTPEFQNIVASVGVTSVKLPPQSPNLNAYAERFVRSIKESFLDRLILFGEASLRKAIGDFVLHYHEERNHQGKGNQL